MNHRGEKYVENFKIIEYNMDKVMDIWYSLDEEKIRKYKELIMLDLDEEGLEKLREISGGDEFMEEFKEKVEKVNKETWFTPWISDEEDDRMILNTEKKISFEEGISQGITEGTLTTKLETARNLKNLHVDVETISKATSLSLEEIEKL